MCYISITERDNNKQKGRFLQMMIIKKQETKQMKQMISEIEFSLKNGFTKVEKTTEKDGSIAFHGSFGYYVVTPEEAKEIDALISKYNPQSKAKKEKLTKTQKEFMDKLENAIFYYTRHIPRESIMHNLYVNGASYLYDVREDGTRIHYPNRPYIIKENTFSVQAKTNTLTALEKKGYIKILNVGGEMRDIIEVVNPIKYVEPMKELSAINFTTVCKYPQDKTIYCPVGEEQQTIAAWKKEHEHLGWEIEDMSVKQINVSVYDWK